jgi:GNAT superfamily N-acetyltransferase
MSFRRAHDLKDRTTQRFWKREITNDMNVRLAEDADYPELVRIWHDGWHDAHAQLVPAEMTRVRTMDNFRNRVSAALPALWVAGDVGAPLGFYVLKGDEVHQFYVCENARGTGVAATLLSDAELRLRSSGTEVGWLACAIGNHRAARFYEKHGWRRAAVVGIDVDTPAGLMPLDVWRYEKRLSSVSPAP